MNASDRKFYIKELAGEECTACGRTKKRGYAFCYRCYTSLPRHMQQALFSKIGHGYEDAFDEAFRWLGD